MISPVKNNHSSTYLPSPNKSVSNTIGRGLTLSNLISAGGLVWLLPVGPLNQGTDVLTNNNYTTPSNSLVDEFLSFRKIAGWVVPAIMTGALGVLSFVNGGSLLESIAEPIANLLDCTSLFAIISDLIFTVMPGALEAADKVKDSMEHQSWKGLLFTVTKFIPFFFIARNFLGKGFLKRVFTGEKIASNESHFAKVLRKEESFVSLAEATKAQVTNIGGITILTTPLRTLIWKARAWIYKGPLSNLAIVGFHFHNPSSGGALLIKKAVSTALLAIMDSMRLGVTRQFLHWLSVTFPWLNMDEKHNIVTLD